MNKRAVMSNAKPSKNFSKKDCACGGHQGKRGKKKRKVSRKTITSNDHEQVFCRVCYQPFEVYTFFNAFDRECQKCRLEKKKEKDNK